jgi:hypothetical protein
MVRTTSLFQNVALRVRRLRGQPVGQPHRLGRLGVIDRLHPDAGLLLETPHHGLGINLVVRGIDHHPALVPFGAASA